MIRTNQVLKIPATTANRQAAAGVEKKTGEALSRSAGTPVPKTVAYKVQSGDTLWKIARRFKVQPKQIRIWNGMKKRQHPSGRYPENQRRPGLTKPTGGLKNFFTTP